MIYEVWVADSVIAFRDTGIPEIDNATDLLTKYPETDEKGSDLFNRYYKWCCDQLETLPSRNN